MSPGRKRTETPPERVGIVILTWNALEHTKACLDSVFGDTDYPDFEVVVVDNGSTDGTLEYLRERSDIEVVENGANLGFSKGSNIGLARLPDRCDVIFLNNDIRITDPDWIGKLRRAAYAADDIALVGCRLVDTEGRINHAGAFMRPVEMYGENIGGLEDDIGQFKTGREVEAVMAAVLYAKRRVLDEIGPFDEEYFSYYEDTDLCFRARKAGYRVWYCGELTLEHAYNTSRFENDFDYWGVYRESGKTFRRKWPDWPGDRSDTFVTWHSTLHHPMGYAQLTREEMRALWNVGVNVSYAYLYGNDDEGNTGDPLIDDIKVLPRKAGSPHVAAGPAELWASVGEGEIGKRAKRAGFTMLEVDGIPRDWVDAANRMDEIWVPSRFNEQTFSESGVRRPIHVIPLGVDTDHFNPDIRPYRTFDEFVFLSVFEWGERKAPTILLQAFNEEFSRDDGVALVIACTNRDPAIDVAGEIEQLRLKKGRAPIILWMNPNLEGYQMGSLYRSADAFALPTKGEGWGMPILEAMACGLPTIATEWSGQTEFYDSEVGFPISVQRLEPAVAKCPYYEGFRWSLPDLEHLRSQMRYVFEHQDEARKVGRKAAERASAYSWAASACAIKSRLEDLG